MPRKSTARGLQDQEAQMIDVHVGRHVRQRRMLIGASQEQLGEHLGLTFQQIQKYEKGTNRISAGRLLQIAGFLGVRVESFFEGLALHHQVTDDPGASRRERAIEFAMTHEGGRWIESYLNAPHPRQRKLAMDVLQLPASREAS